MNYARLMIVFVCSLTVAAAVFGVPGYKAVKTYSDVNEVRNHLRYQIEAGETIAAAPADATLSTAYLEIIFGENPELLDQLLGVVDRGMAETPDMNLGQVAAIIVTYRQDEAQQISEVVAHIVGEFPLGRRQVNMHKGGFMENRMDGNLWDTKRSALSFVGRDIIVWAEDETVERPQQELIEAIFAGEISYLVNTISEDPLYYTAVFPNPRDLVPMRMRPHIRAILYNGMISPQGGEMDMIALCNDERSAGRMVSMFQDAVDSAETALRTRFGGEIVETAWNKDRPEVWWAYEMAEALDKIKLTQSESTIRLDANYEREVVNAIMKIIERFGRDYTAILGVQDQKVFPGEVRDFMGDGNENPRWTPSHVTGPDWPFGPTTLKSDIQPE
jgi:hypothetical protein